MEKAISMDASQIAILCTTNQSIYMKERMSKDPEFFGEFNDPELKAKTNPKEPELSLISRGTYPLAMLLTFLKRAKDNDAGCITIQMARSGKPIRIEFVSRDRLNVKNGSENEEKTWFYLAPKIDDFEYDNEEADLSKNIPLFEKELEIMQVSLVKIQVEKAKDATSKTVSL